MEQPPELRHLFHRLNNQLGIILAHAELMEAKAGDESSRARATQVVSSVLDAMGTAKEIRMQMGAKAVDERYRSARSPCLNGTHPNVGPSSASTSLTPAASRFRILHCAELQLATPKIVISNCQ